MAIQIIIIIKINALVSGSDTTGKSQNSLKLRNGERLENTILDREII